MIPIRKRIQGLGARKREGALPKDSLQSWQNVIPRFCIKVLHAKPFFIEYGLAACVATSNSIYLTTYIPQLHIFVITFE